MKIASGKHLTLINGGVDKCLFYILKCPYCGKRLNGVYTINMVDKCYFCKKLICVVKDNGKYKVIKE